MATQIIPRDYQYLSAYLDGQLNGKDRQSLEARLAQEPNLRDELNEMRRMHAVLRSLPRSRAPRNFTLTPEMAGQRQQKPARLYPVMGFTAALASLLFVLIVLGDFLGYIPTNSGGIESAVVQESAPLAFAPTEGVEEGDAQMRSVAPLEESAAPLETEPLTTDEGLFLAPAVEDELSSQMALPESITPTEEVMASSVEVEAIATEQPSGMGAGIYTDTLEMPLGVFALPPDVTSTPTPMPTETPVATPIPLSTATNTPTPVPTETPSVYLKELLVEQPTLTPTMEILAMAEEDSAGESSGDMLRDAAGENGEFLPEEEAPLRAFSIHPVLVIQIGLLVLAMITGAAFLFLRFKEE